MWKLSVHIRISFSFSFLATQFHHNQAKRQAESNDGEADQVHSRFYILISWENCMSAIFECHFWVPFWVPFLSAIFCTYCQKQLLTRSGLLRGTRTWRDSFCSLRLYFLSFLTSTFPTTFVIPNFIPWFGNFLKVLQENEKCPRNHPKSPASHIFIYVCIVLSIVLKLGTPLLHTQAQDMRWRFFKFS